MRVYFEQIKNIFKQRLAYRVEYVFGTISNIIWLLIQICIWQALIGQKGEVSSNVGTITLREMITYAIVSSMISALLRSPIMGITDQRIQNGSIAMDLLKPVNFHGLIFSSTIGNLIFNFIFQLIPFLVIGLVFFDMALPSLGNLLLCCATLPGSIILNFLVYYCFALFAFWYTAPTRNWTFLFGSLSSLFSGAIIPLWFFPKAMANVAEYLPFKLFYQASISIYLGKFESIDVLFIILQQLIWIAIAYAGVSIVWRQGIKKLIIQGG